MAIKFEPDATAGFGLYSAAGTSGLPTTAGAPWTLSLWYRPANTTAGAFSGVRFGNTTTYLSVYVFNSGYLAYLTTNLAPQWATSPGTMVTWGNGAVSTGAWIAWRYSGGTTYDKWIDGTKTAISLSGSITIPSYSGIVIGTHTGMAASPPTANVTINGAFAELAVWTSALTDAEMVALQRGMAADQIQRATLANYWPMRGVSTNSLLVEPNYVNASNTLRLQRAHGQKETRIEHPAIYSPTTTAYSFPAWVLKLGGTDAAPTFTAASTVLASETDYDVLGCTPAQTIVDVESIVVNSELSDPHYGVQLPTSTTINLHNADYISHAAAVSPGRIGGGSTARDPAAFWRLSSPSESGVATSREVMSGVAGTTAGTVSANQTGGLTGDSSTCMTFNGGAFTTTLPAAPSLGAGFSFACWIKPSNTTQTTRYIVAPNECGVVYGYETRSGQITALDSVVAGGTGYAVGDILTLSGGTGGTVRVLSVNGGTVLGVELVSAGYLYSASTTYATSGAAGSGCTIKVSTVNSTARSLLRFVFLNSAALNIDIPDTGWHHVAWTHDGTTARSYLDGALVGAVASVLGSTGIAGAATIYIGAANAAGGNGFSGSLQDVAYWSLALTSSEVQTLYKAGAGLLGYPPGRTWIDQPARLYRYDAQTHEYVAELAGSVSAAQFSTGLAAITVQDYDPAIFNTQIPRQTITVDMFPSGDIGAPIPIPFGRATFTLPMAGEDLIGNPGGRDFLLGQQVDGGASSNTLHLVAAYYDQDDASPGLEPILSWDAAPGTPTKYSATAYSVTGDQSATYLQGSLMRAVTDNATYAGQWIYFFVTSYDAINNRVALGAISPPRGISTAASGGYVTDLAAAPVAAGSNYAVGDILTLVGGTAAKAIVVAASSGAVTEVRLTQPGYGYSTGTKTTTASGGGSGCTVRVLTVSGPQIAALDAMILERGRYSVNASQNLSSIRLLGNTDAAGVVGTVVNSHLDGGSTDNRNPASVIATILSSTTWGLAEAVDASLLSVAQYSLYTAGLGTAINGALGGDRQQRAAGDVLNELLMMRGMRLTRRVDGSWAIAVDAAPTTWTVLEVGGARNNVVSIDRRQRTPASEAVSVLEVRYGMRGRVASTTDYKSTFQPSSDYLYSVLTTAQSYGGRRTITLPWVQSHGIAARVAQYLARRMRYAEETVEVTVPSLVGRTLTLGDGVRLVSASDGIDGDYRVRSISRGLVRSVVLLESYDSRLFAAYDSSEIDYEYDSTGALQQADYAPEIDTLYAPGDGANLIANCDFSVPLTDAVTLPGYYVNASDRAWTMTIDSDIRYMGGSAVQIATTNGQLTADLVPLSRLVTDDQCSTVVAPGETYLFSFYTDDIAGVSVNYAIFDNATPALATQIDYGTASLYRMAGEKNALGWSRYYATIRIRQPWVTGGTLHTPAMLGIYLECVSDGGTYSFDALQLEKAGQRTHKPTPWKRHPRWGVDPAAITPGDLTIRADGALTSSTRTGILELELTRGSTEFSGGIPAGYYVFGITAKVIDTIVATGATKWRIGSLYLGQLSLWGGDTRTLSLTTGEVTTKDDWSGLWTPTMMTTGDIVLVQAIDNNGAVKTLTSGAVTVRIHYMVIE